MGVRVRLPGGELTELGDGRVRVALSLDARTRDAVRAIVERLDGVAADWFWIPTTVDEVEGDLVLDYALATEGAMPFADALSRLVARPAVHLPELVELGRYLEACTRVLSQVEVPALIAPACLRYAPTRERGAWRLMVVPLGDPTLAEWACAAPAAWLWTPSRALLGKAAPAAGAYAIGAALATALGGFVPAHLARGARFARVLRGWVGRPAVIQAAVARALPASFGDEAAALAALIPALLEPTPPSDWAAQLAAIGDQLAPYRTAVRWEYEGNIEVARGILERFAATAPREAVPWDVVARLRGLDQDVAGALQAAIDGIGAGDDAVRELAAVTRRIAHARPPDESRAMIERAIAAADGLGSRLGDLGRLHFAHLEARYLGRLSEAQARLAAPAKEPWDNVLRATIVARIHAGRAEWAHVAREVKAARAATQAMSQAGGTLGHYVVAYLDYLDGVAHHGAVGQYRDPGYLADAFSRLVACSSATVRVCDPSDPLIDSCIHWLYSVGDLAHELGVPEAVAIRTGIHAYLDAEGLGRRISEHQRRERPQVVWYDASRLLALSGAP